MTIDSLPIGTTPNVLGVCGDGGAEQGTSVGLSNRWIDHGLDPVRSLHGHNTSCLRAPTLEAKGDDRLVGRDKATVATLMGELHRHLDRSIRRYFQF
eukprot:CAMPEP_0175870700 /NCGR_PEP_ID=MMETSP0107_2-20121207/36707_1 /TAXON_ID=195067 ORGANISM="Goniomonas pacifica, Strain CCMP1869" /NCGR_SAMPLE_ID=MMETSP0107_2 /ASSEMBLY_ACC=CAM_ASM_000203 /LENGTH=96 /DNA_ID=CAMNT_0017188961 /DNA_START=51 /DNA_END=338 /DNA_ORIENTATION=-